MFALMAIILSVLAGVYVGRVSRDAVERDIGTLHANRAQHIADAIDVCLGSNVGAMQLAAGLMAVNGPPQAGDAERRLIETIGLSVKDAAWIGVADRNGTVIAGDKGLLENSSLSNRDWFTSALQGAVTGGPETVPQLQGLAANADNDELGFLAVAAPMKDTSGDVVGVTIAYFAMERIDRVWRAADARLTYSRKADIFVYDRDGTLLTPSTAGSPTPEAGFYEGISQALAADAGTNISGSMVSGEYLFGYANVRGSPSDGLTGWKVVVREPLEFANASADNLAAIITVSCLALGITLSLAAAISTALMLGRLSKIAQSADMLRNGSVNEFSDVGGRDEVGRISRSLALLFNNWKASNLELANLNQNLEAKVAERTREVHRLSEETRNAAITRERLRLSRDLHDTLAHTMLAMLTQIRLIRKLFRMKPEMVEEELEHAEQAAQEGLARARDAVTELRYFAVRDDGLEHALRKLLARLKERVEIEVSLDVDPPTASLAGPSAETVYRVAEEALHNIEKHANARRARISVALRSTVLAGQVLQLTVEDDGKGFDPAVTKDGHFGLMGMREQADALGAKLFVVSSPQEGTRIHLDVPL